MPIPNRFEDVRVLSQALGAEDTQFEREVVKVPIKLGRMYGRPCYHFRDEVILLDRN